MDYSTFRTWAEQNPLLVAMGLLAAGGLVLLFTRNIVVRTLVSLASSSTTKIDDILVKHLHPLRIAWLAPLGLAYAFAFLIPDLTDPIRRLSLFLILVLSVLTLIGLLNAFNEIYESRPGFSGVSIQGYLDLAKILIVLIGVILSVSLFSGQSPLVLLTGLGALTAVLLLIFQDTIKAVVASVQIGANDLIKEGDWIEVPSYSADGDVVNINLHTIKIQNFDKTFTIIPTHKIVDVAYKNWRGMQESGGRRIQRALRIDMTSVKFCDEAMLRQLSRIDLIQDYLTQRIRALETYARESSREFDSPLDGPQITNTEIGRSALYV